MRVWDPAGQVLRLSLGLARLLILYQMLPMLRPMVHGLLAGAQGMIPPNRISEFLLCPRPQEHEADHLDGGKVKKRVTPQRLRCDTETCPPPPL